MRWVLPGEVFNFAGYEISSGLFYTCDGEPDPDEASAINTLLPVRAPARGEQAALGYYSQYQFISMAQRGAYLEWLAAGRRDEDPTTRDLGYVFLFIYGLERRLLIDGAQDQEAVAELVRLLDRYGHSRSLRSYVCQLIHFWGWKQGPEYYAQLRDWMDALPVSLLGEDEMALVLASLHLAGKPLTPELAYDVAFRHPEARHSVIVRRVNTEFKELFAKRYAERFPKGIALHAVAPDMQIDYRPASPSLLQLIYRHPAQFKVKIPNVLGYPEQFRPLLSIWESCLDDLAGYSRVRAKAGSAASLKAHMALPEELRAKTAHPLASQWEGLLQNAQRENGCVIVSAGEVAGMIEIAKRAKLTPTQSRDVAQAIESFGYALEPDARYTGLGYAWDQEIGVFQPKNGGSPRPSANCRGAQQLLELCVFVAGSDGHVSPDELAVARKFIEGQLALSPEDKERLDVAQHVLVGDPVKASDSLPRIARHVLVEQREKIAQVLVLIAATDNIVTKDELRALERVSKVFGLAPGKLDSLLQSIRPEFGEVTVQPAGKTVPGEAIPPDSGFRLDMSRVEAIAKETTEVIGILSEVMADEEEQPPAPAPSRSGKVQLSQPAPAKAPQLGTSPPAWMAELDAKYQPVLQKLLERDSWSRPEFESLTKSFHLMPLDAHDTINEWADEHLGDFLLEGDKVVQINKSLIPKGETADV